MKNLLLKLFTLTLIILTSCKSQIPKDEIWLLVRGDDIGSSHAANVGCIESYQNGIVRSVELMVPCPWFPEAVKMLNENPGLDVGLHLVMTSEWSNMKWRPLTDCPSLVDSNGYFYPMVWENENFGKGANFQHSGWKIEEVEKELRAQIELGLKKVPHITHMGGHMGFAGVDPRIADLMKKLAKEYDLEVDFSQYGKQRFSGWGKAKITEDRIDSLAINLSKLEPGLYMFVDHPGKDVPEMQAIWHKGYEHVAQDRDAVTNAFTSEKVKAVIKEKNIKLVSYKDIKELGK